MPNSPIDIVVPWVDSSDPAWQAEHALYTADRNSDNSAARYRDWDTLRYWFRGVEQFAPWVRTVHFVTWGHVPAWLDTENPKLHIVNHRDYIPAEYLPTFSSHTIELNLHRIEGLSENFLYFNDDVYLAAPTEATDFFRDGKPLDTATFAVISNGDTANFMPYIMLNMMAIINEKFPKRAMLKRDFFKWITPRNGKGMLHNLYLLPWGMQTGFRNYHSCNGFCKSTFEAVWAENFDVLDRTCRHKFRSREDVNQYLMRFWQLCSGNFLPRKPISRYLTMGEDSAAYAAEVLRSGRYKVVCINDDPLDFDFDAEQQTLLAGFEALFPQPSSFEKAQEGTR